MPGIGPARQFPWHRDVWYAVLAQQVNWWLPVFELSPDNSLAFDLSAVARRVDNDSATFDYEREIGEPRLAQPTSSTATALALPAAAAPLVPAERTGTALGGHLRVADGPRPPADPVKSVGTR